MGERNKSIKHSIERQEVPILPYELELAQAAFKLHSMKQDELGKKMGEMMKQSSETWHDNAPAEAIMNDSKILAVTAEQTMRVIRSGRVFDYDNDDGKVSLGSLVGVRYEGDDEVVRIYLTGASRELPSFGAEGAPGGEEQDFNDVECATIFSPVGRAVFDKSAGETVEFDAGGRSISLTIVSVN